jgi:hypothetical protein
MGKAFLLVLLGGGTIYYLKQNNPILGQQVFEFVGSLLIDVGKTINSAGNTFF